MDSDPDNLEEKLASLLGQLWTEFGVLERMVYKNKNQHRRCSYFKHLLKVRRDLKLLQTAKLEELISSSFQVISGKKPKQKAHLLESLKRQKCEGGKHNFMERLLGAARLLSEMAEPILKAATEISTLLARSFFMGFCLTILAVLARLRVLVQEILLNVVSVFNIVSSLSQKQHSIKITQEGLEVYREFYPTNKNFAILECVWESDKFILHERTQKTQTVIQDGLCVPSVSVPIPAVEYHSIESIVGDDENSAEQVATADQTADNDQACSKENENDSRCEKLAGSTPEVRDGSDVVTGPSKPQEGPIFNPSSCSVSARKPEPKKVAFVSVKHPPLAASSLAGFNVKGSKIEEENKDPFFRLLSSGVVKDSLF